MVCNWSRNCDLWLSSTQLVFVLSSTGALLIHPPAAPSPLPPVSSGPSPAVPWDAMMLWQLAVCSQRCWYFGGTEAGASPGIVLEFVVFSVGVGDLGRAGLVGDQWDSKPLCRQKETREDCVSQLSACRFSPSLLTHKFDEQRCLSRQSWDI